MLREQKWKNQQNKKKHRRLILKRINSTSVWKIIIECSVEKGSSLMVCKFSHFLIKLPTKPTTTQLSNHLFNTRNSTPLLIKKIKIELSINSLVYNKNLWKKSRKIRNKLMKVKNFIKKILPTILIWSMISKKASPMQLLWGKHWSIIFLIICKKINS